MRISAGRSRQVDSLSDFDRQRLEQFNSLLRDDLEILYEIDRKQAVENRPLEKRQLRQQAEHAREVYNRHREEYADLLRKEIPTRFAADEQALITAVVKRLNADQLALTRTALQEADHVPNDPDLAQLRVAVAGELPAMQQQLAAKSTPEAAQIAQAVRVIQDPLTDASQKLKLSIPLIPLFLSYETELRLNITANLKAAWERLKQRFHPT
jgi:hypothetical protein